MLSPSRYPDELAWQIDLGRKAIRQESKLKNLHQFLIQETESVSNVGMSNDNYYIAFQILFTRVTLADRKQLV